MSAPVLVCFAVPQEARPFQKWLHGRADVRVLITGMGATNAEAGIRRTLKEFTPARVFTCGFAGALQGDLQIGAVVCSHEHPLPGVKPVRFHCAKRVAITVEEKTDLRLRTGAEAVEMESAVIEQVCRKAGIPCTTLRVISDTAQENLPLDFNALMTADQKLSSLKLAWAIACAPHKIPPLMRLGKNSARAAEQLAEALVKVLALPTE